MTFNCTAHRTDCFHETAEQRGDKWVVMVPIGFDADGGMLTYYFVVHTYPSEGSTEFAFLVGEINNRTGEQRAIYDSAISNSIIPSACRRHISAILNYYARQIIEMSKPDNFFMETFCKNLPLAALTKYDILTQIFSGLGYSVSSAPSAGGKHKWVMKLQHSPEL